MYDVNNTTENSFDNIDTNEVNVTIFVVIYILIGFCGLFGNALVIYVILISPKMRTLTNMYLLNLAFSDLIFLSHIAMVTTTIIIEYWVFGEIMCKIFFTTQAITTFSSVLTLTSLSVDRYIAVCKPDVAYKYRQPLKAVFVIISIWIFSLLLSMPIILYSRRIPHPYMKGKDSCMVNWQDVKEVPIYIIYIFILGFAIPLCFISTFYTCVIVHMKSAGPANRQRSKEQHRYHRKITYLVLAIILSYVICWLPYWIFQIVLVVVFKYKTVAEIMVIQQICTVLMFANSMVNPFLYAFINRDFRHRFKEVFQSQCVLKERSGFISTKDNDNKMELDLLPRHDSNQIEAEQNK
ncbi:somatostatin receptor type 2-like [Saccostrea echinata]|uniref:somatostatin receptor type 2-like n=1 Tax=Saccostrea echinata TaxID=191078 RepID=UPI002A81A4B2|nr:somatostatin receptor type 2-like [Saccostrea echinata]